MDALGLLIGGDLCQALKHDDELAWYKNGHLIALDIVRGLHFLHSNGVRNSHLQLQFARLAVMMVSTGGAACAVQLWPALGCTARSRSSGQGSMAVHDG